MTAPGAVKAGQRAAERLMRDRCVLERSTGQATDAAGNVTDTWDTIYQGRCKVQQTTFTGQTVDSGAQLVDLVRPELHLPIGAPAPQVKDRATITSSQNPALVGAVFWLSNPIAAKTFATAQRWACTQVIG